MFFRKKNSGKYDYLQIVENKRQDKKVRQRVVATIGRADKLEESGELDRLLESGARFSEKVMAVSAHENGEAVEVSKRKIGPALIFERLWKQTGCRDAVEKFLTERKFQFPVERAAFLTVLHRLFDPGSDRAAEEWREDYRIDGAESLQLHHIYRTMAWLGEVLPGEDQEGATGFSPRCTKDFIEEELFRRNRDLFSSLDIVFFDTTSIYFEGEGGETLGAHGNSKDHRPDLKQIVVGAVLDAEGRPVCCEIWPGNTTDVKTLVPIVNRLKKRFNIGNICIVADRGMISAKTIREIENPQLGWKFILGARMRSQKEVKEDVLSTGGRYRIVHPAREKVKDPSPLKVKDVWVGVNHYVICLNEEQARKDAADREAIVAALQDALKHGDKSLVGNKGYRKFVKASGKRFEIDEAKIKAEARYDGKWVLRTNTGLSPEETALKYKQLWMVEALFRSIKSVLETRPIYHKTDAAIRGHVFCSFLGLVLAKELQERMFAAGHILEWDHVIRDLDDLEEVDVRHKNKCFRLRTPAKRTCGKVFQSAGVALPPTIRQVSGDETG